MATVKMTAPSSRTLIAQLADDLGWLEEHGRRATGQNASSAELRLAAALVRNCIGPFLDGQAPLPLHVAVVGGAGAGKSTVANMLSGGSHAEMNPQAGFTRHPIAYTGGNGALTWPAHNGFLGSLQRLHEPAPANLDADVYQVERIAGPDSSFVDRFVIWDCPDMTTWAATGYVPRMLEIVGLADIVVYVASDERYNDEVPTAFLRLLLQAGKPVIVCLVKMREADQAAIIEHFRKEVLNRIPGGVVACLSVPFMTAEELAEPAVRASRYRIPLVNQISVLGEPATVARQRTVDKAATYLLAAQERLLGVARDDVTALADWRNMVRLGEEEFNRRYTREYLTTEKFRRFDEALVRLLELLELPGGAGKIVSQALWVVRTPYRLVRGVAAKALRRPEANALPEQPLLEHALAAWLDLLRKETARRASSGRVWAHIEQGFEGNLAGEAQARFQQGLSGFRLGLADEVDRTARAIYEELEKNPIVLNTLRGGKLTIDMAAIVTAVVTAGQHWALDFVLVPVAAAISHQLVELLGKQYVDNQREQTRSRQQALVMEYLSEPLAEWLIRWPTTGGSAYEHLNQALERVPALIRQIDQAVREEAVAK
jgi:hypothetical protein